GAACWRGAGGSGLIEAEVAFDEQAEAAAAGLVEANGRAALVEPALQEDEARVEVVAEAGKLETWVEPDLFVREVDASVGEMLLEQRPEDAPRDAADEVVAVKEDAAVDREVPHPRGGALVRGDGRGHSRDGLGRLTLAGPVDLDRAREERRHHAQQGLVVVVERDGSVIFDDEQDRKSTRL